MVNVQDCDIKVTEFELIQFRTNTLRKCTDSLISSAMCKIVPLLFFHNDGFIIK